jgi:toxin secretion/phage lysis holin
MNRWETFLGGIAAGIGFLFGRDENVLRVLTGLAVLMAFDIVTGVIRAAYKGEVSSRQWTKGAIKKVSLWLLISVCYTVDKYGIINAGVSLEAAAALYIAVGEFISILENIVELDIKLPKVLIAILEKGQAAADTQLPDMPDLVSDMKAPIQIRNALEDGGPSDGK